MIFLVYLELNPVERIIENINHSVMAVKAIMLCMSLKQFFPNVGIFHIIILLHFILVVVYRPDSINIGQTLQTITTHIG